MVEIEAAAAGAAAGNQTPTPRPAFSATQTKSERMALLRKQYAVPVPIRTLPLPSFYPSNPLSLVHVACAWLSQALWPPPAEPSIIHIGVWSPATRSVNITDPRSMRTLWEQGFYGKGNYSRSEPSWMKRKAARKGTLDGDGFVAENATLQRRAEREQTKWERSRAQIEALEQTRQEEAHRRQTPRQRQVPSSEDGSAPSPIGLPNGRVRAPDSMAPVGPLQLLALPNSTNDLANGAPADGSNGSAIRGSPESKGMNGSARSPEAPAPGAGTQLLPDPALEPLDPPGTVVDTKAPEPEPQGHGANGSATTNGHVEPEPLKRRKSVRFSPRVESTTFQHSDPPSPHHSTVNLTKPSGLRVSNELTPSPTQLNGSILIGSTQLVPTAGGDVAEIDVGNKEHLQLGPEEAFFLSFAIGALVVLRPDSGDPFTTKELFELFRRQSYFPPRMPDPESDDLSPDDPFLVRYAVYHHFRSLGWVVRGGIKFGVDWLIYKGGPVFDHADFGLLVVPEYSDPWWKEHGGARSQSEPWHWLHCHNRTARALLVPWSVSLTDARCSFSCFQAPCACLRGCSSPAYDARQGRSRLDSRRISHPRNHCGTVVAEPQPLTSAGGRQCAST